MTLQMLKAVPAGASGVASADSAPPAASATGVPPMAPLPMKAMTIAAATPRTVMIAMGQGLWFVRASPDVGWSVEWESFVAIATRRYRKTGARVSVVNRR